MDRSIRDRQVRKPYTVMVIRSTPITSGHGSAPATPENGSTRKKLNPDSDQTIIHLKKKYDANTNQNISLYLPYWWRRFLFSPPPVKKYYALPTASDKLHEPGHKKNACPNIVGQQIEFAYAMAILPSKGKLVACVAEASIAGPREPIWKTDPFYTAQTGADGRRYRRIPFRDQRHDDKR